MKATPRKKTCLAALVIVASANSPAVLADGPFIGTLGAGNVNFAPTDVYGLTCPAGTASVRARVTNPNGSAADEISTQLINLNGRAKTVISLEGVAPPIAVLAGGAGNYLATVHKDSTPFAVSYKIVLDCHNANGVAFAGTQSALIQNQ